MLREMKALETAMFCAKRATEEMALATAVTSPEAQRVHYRRRLYYLGIISQEQRQTEKIPGTLNFASELAKGGKHGTDQCP